MKNHNYMNFSKMSPWNIVLTLVLLILTTVQAEGQSYCSSGATNSNNSEIDKVVFNTINNSTAGICATYSDFTNIGTVMTSGVTYTLSVTAGTCNSDSWKYVSAWIDYNDDGDFLDANEFLGNIGSTYYTATLSTNTTIPTTNVKFDDSLRLRIICIQGSYPSNACNIFSYGETEDYTVRIIKPFANDAGVVSIDSPSIPIIPGLNNVKVKIKNYGTDTLFSAGIDWKVDNVSGTAYSWSGTIPPGDTSGLITLGSYNFNAGTHEIIAFTKNPNSKTDSNKYNDTFSKYTFACNPMSGTYTIGSHSSDSFGSFSDAISKLALCGVKGPVKIKVDSGSYNEQLIIPLIDGVSSTNTITFESANLDSTSVRLYYASSNYNTNYTVLLNGAQYINFNKITIEGTGNSYATALVFENTAANNNFTNNVIKGVLNYSSSNNYTLVKSNNNSGIDSANIFNQNLFLFGSGAIMFYSNTLEEKNKVTNNTFYNQYYYALDYERQSNLQVVDNIVYSDVSDNYFYAFYLYQCDSGLIVTGNTIDVTNCYESYGIYLDNCSGSNNHKGLVANNFVSIYGQNDAWSEGISIYSCSYQQIYYNSVNLYGSVSNNSKALRYDGYYEIDLKNNILNNKTNGYSFYSNNNSGIKSDYNDLYTTGSYLGYWSNNIANLTNWISTTKLDSNSISAIPMFNSNSDLHSFNIDLNGKAKPISTVSIDIDKESRNATTPDIGADEFTPKSLDIGISSLFSPNTPVNPGVNDVKVYIKNFGLSTVYSGTVEWMFDGVGKTPFSFTDTLYSGDTSKPITIGTANFTQGTHFIKVWTKDPNSSTDQNKVNDTLEISVEACTQMAGVYTIGNSSSDSFSSFKAAINALINNCGVKGPVVFKVADGTYNEQVLIPAIYGASSTNRITFESVSGDSSKVILAYSSSSSSYNYTLKLDGADYFIFQKMTIQANNYYYARAVAITNGATNNQFLNNQLFGYNYSTSSNYNAVVYQYIDQNYSNDYNLFEQNYLLYGSYSFYLYGDYSYKTKGIVIKNNIIINPYYCGIYIYSHDASIIENNTIYSSYSGNYFYGINSYYGINDFKFRQNKVISPYSSGGYGLYLIYNYGDNSKRGLISNNFISLNSSYNQAIGIYHYGNTYLDIVYNSVNIIGNYSSTYGLYYYSWSNSYNTLLNNIFSNKAGGNSMYYDYYVPDSSDYNDFYSSGAYLINSYSTLSGWQSASSKDIHSINVDPGFTNPPDLHTLNTQLNGKGIPIANELFDIDYETRDTIASDIGADEFTPPRDDAGVFEITSPVTTVHVGSNPVKVIIKNYGVDTLKSVSIDWSINGVSKSSYSWSGSLPSGVASNEITIGSHNFAMGNSDIKVWTRSPNSKTDGNSGNDTFESSVFGTYLCDTFTIGATGADFPSFTSAIDSLKAYGVCGPVVFTVDPGTYNEQISIPEILGASSANTITFTSLSSSNTNVILSYSPSSSSYNYIIDLNGADHIIFSNISIKNTYYYYNRVIYLRNGANYNTFSNDIIEGVQYSTTSSYNYLIYSPSGTNNNGNTFSDNVIKNGSNGIYCYGTDNQSGWVVKNNQFINQYYRGIYIYENTSFLIENNEITTNTSYSYFYAIYLYYNFNDFKVIKNRIYNKLDVRTYGIYCYYSSGQSNNHAIIANNFISLNSNSYTSTGIYLGYNSSYVDLLYNSVNIYGSQTSSYALYYYSYNSNLNIIKNNILNNLAKGYCFYSSYNYPIISDYNNFYTNGNYIGYYSGNITDLATWKSTTAADTNSISLKPDFISNSDLHTFDTQLDGKGTPLTSVSDDIDGETRNSSIPDIGADEFSPPKVDAGIFEVSSPVATVHSGTFPVKVSIKNYGTDTLKSVSIDWVVNGTTKTTYSWTGSLANGQIASNITIGSHNFNLGSNSLKAWTKNPNSKTDENLKNDTLLVSLQGTYLCDTFTIGGTGADFPSFTSAVDSMKTYGICGPVVFVVSAGTYNEQISIPEILGASSTNTISFISLSSSNTDVILTYYSNSSTYNYVIDLNGADYITFENISIKPSYYYYGRAIYIRNGANNNSFINNLIENIQYSSTSTYSALVYVESGINNNDNVFSSNTFKNGSFGIYCYGSNNQSGWIVKDNQFFNNYYMGLYLRNSTSFLVENNYISTSNSYTYFYGIYVTSCNYKYKIIRNTIYNSGDVRTYGIYLSSSYGESNNYAMVSNNFISLRSNSYQSMGIYCDYCQYVNFYYNSINIFGSNTSSNGFYYYGNGNDVNEFKNNIFSNSANGYSFYSANTYSIISNYNDLYTTGNVLGYYGGDRSDIAAWRSATTEDNNSISVVPDYFSNTDLHTFSSQINAKGTPVSTVTNDIDGQTRNSTTPDIGADEFTPPNVDAGVISLQSPISVDRYGTKDIVVSIRNFASDTLVSATIEWQLDGVTKTPYSWSGSVIQGDTAKNIKISTQYLTFGSHTFKIWTKSPNSTLDGNKNNDTLLVTVITKKPLSGSYTIGAGTSDSFPTFKAAVDSMISNGVMGAVTFLVKNGTYNEQITIPPINGVNQSNTVTFKSYSEDSTKVIVTYSPSWSNNYLLYLNGADYFTFKQITFKNLNYYGIVVQINNEASHNKFLNNVFESSQSTSTYNSLIYSPGSKDEYNEFTQNHFVNGSFGFYYYSNSSSDNERGTIIKNNLFSNVYYMDIYLEYQDAVQIHTNTILANSVYSSHYGIYLYQAYNNLLVNKNKITINTGGYGMHLYYLTGTSSKRCTISNNFISVGGTNQCYGIYFYGSNYSDLYYNSINLTNTNSNSRSMYAYSGSNNRLINNILANRGGGYAYYLGSGTYTTSDYNDIFATGTYLGYYSGSRTDLSAWKSATGRDAHSLSKDPSFVSFSDLHTSELFLNGAGLVVSGITDDIDGDTRSNSKPDIGADEFTPPSNDAGIVALLSPVKPFYADSQSFYIRIRNAGTDTLRSVKINWKLNSINKSQHNWTGLLKPGDTTSVNIGNHLMTVGSLYNFVAWTSLPNNLSDGNALNDTLKVNDLHPALNGVYTIGGTSPDFSSFGAAVAALKYGGIIDSAWFNVRNGTYTEQINIPQIYGASDYEDIVFRSESGDSSKVILQYSANSSANYTVKLDGADGIAFEKITLKSLQTTYGRVVEITNESNNNIFRNNVLFGITTTSTSTNYALVFSDYGFNDNGNVFSQNYFYKGSFGLYLSGYSNSPYETGCIIKDNYLLEQRYTGIYTYYLGAPIIKNNILENNVSSGHMMGIYCQYTYNGTQITGNKFSYQNYCYGIHLYACYANSSDRGLISNNFISNRSSSGDVGIYLYYSDYYDVYYNTVNNIGSNSYCMQAIYSYYTNIKNNIFANSGTGYTLYTNYPSGIISCDYNNYFGNGTYLAYWGGNVTNLAALKTATGMNQHSLSIDPLFISSSDLHIEQVGLNRAATPISFISKDIDGETRDSQRPDIGADEFFPPLTDDAAIVALVSPATRFPADSVNIKVLLSNYGSDSLKNARIYWSVNGVNQGYFSWTGALATNETDTVTLGKYRFLINKAYAVKAWSALPNGYADSSNLNDTTYKDGLYAALNGTYTIGGSNPDFATFNDAITNLNIGGVLGKVTFNVRTGTYTELFRITQSPGISATNSVTFQSQDLDSTKVILTYQTAYNRTLIDLDGADYINFRKMTISSSGYPNYGRNILLRNGANNITFENNIIKGPIVDDGYSSFYLIYSESTVDDNLKLDHNQFYGGIYGLYLYGNGTSGMEKTIISNNLFTDQHINSIYAYYQDDLGITNNIIELAPTYPYQNGITLNYCNNGLRVLNNKIIMSEGNYGISLNSCSGISTDRGLIANNFIKIGGENTSYGLNINSSTYQDYYFNNILSTGTSSSESRTVYMYYASNLAFKNNNAINYGNGYSVYTVGTSSVVSDYNNLFSKGTNLAYYSNNITSLSGWKSATGLDAHSLSVDPLFISNNNLHVREVTLKKAGISISGITTDIDGDNRNSSKPDIGADEFQVPFANDAGLTIIVNPTPFPADTLPVRVVLKNFGYDTLNSAIIKWTINNASQTNHYWSGSILPGKADTISIGNFIFKAATQYDFLAYSTKPNGVNDSLNNNDTASLNNLYAALSGTYTIGGTNPDFYNFTSAVTNLNYGGVLGVVLFNVRNGVYNEQITINSIIGSSSVKTITFQSEKKDSILVKLTYNSTYSNNFVLRLNGADYVNFKKMTFQSVNSSYGHVIELTNESKFNTFSNCIVKGIVISSTSTNYNVIHISDALNTDNEFSNNRIENGSYGIYSISSVVKSGLKIKSNVILNQYYTALYLEDESEVEISGNIISTDNCYSSYLAINLQSARNQFKVFNNKLDVPHGYGIYLNSCEGTSTKRGVVYNNFVHVGGNSIAIGIYQSSCTYTDLFFNNINISSDDGSQGRGYYNSGGSNLLVKNNIFMNSGGGYAIYIGSTSSISGSDYNDFFTTGTNLAYWNGNRTTFSAYKSASSMDSHSKNEDPFYFTDSNLHVSQIALDSSGIGISGYSKDIDGENRSSTKPDIGADEFRYVSDDIGVLALSAPVSNCELGAKDSVRVKVQNYGAATQTGFKVSYSINGGTTVTQSVGSFSIPRGSSKIFTFSTTADFSAYGTYTIKCYTTLATDTVYSNDTLVATITNFQAPSVVANMLPSDSSLNLSPPVTFSWSPSNSTTDYDLFIWKYGQSQPATPTVANISQISHQYSGSLLYGTTYNWKLNSKNAYCQTSGNTQRFGLRSLPDLIVSSISVPSTAFSGKNISLSWQIKNDGQGSTLSTSWYDAVYLSSDNTLDLSVDVYLGAIANMSALSNGSSYSQTSSFTLPHGISGNYYIFIITDKYDNLLETDNSNNTSTGSSSISVSLTPPPDLIVSSIVTPKNVYSGTTINVKWTVNNKGTGNTVNNYWYDAVYLYTDTTFTPASSIYLGSFYHSGQLIKDSSYTNSRTFNISNNIFGKYYIFVYTDATNLEYEHALENNNVGRSDSINIILTPPPDLVISSIMAPDTVNNAEGFYLNYAVGNEGGNTATDSWTDRIYISPSPTFNSSTAIHLADRNHYSDLDPGNYDTVSVWVTIPNNYNGFYYIFIKADYNNTVYEYSYENNNTSSADTIRIISPDLIVNSISNPATGNSGTNMTVKWKIKNNGPGKLLNRSFTDKVYISSSSTFSLSTATELGSASITTTLQKDNIQQISKTVTIPNGYSGTYYLYVHTDANNNIFENGADANNILKSDTSIYITLSPWPDLIVSEVETIDSATAGDNLSIYFKVKNNGVADAKGSSWVDNVYLSKDSILKSSATLLKSVTRSQSLAIADSYSITTLGSLANTLTKGYYYILVNTDAGNTIYEHTDNNNNVGRFKLHIQPYPPIDLAMTNVSSPDSGYSGKAINVSYSVKNIGQGATNAGTYYNGFYLSADSTWDPGDRYLTKEAITTKLYPGSSYTKSLSITLPNGVSGNFYLLAVTDIDNVNNDIDIYNNYRSRTNSSNVMQKTKIKLTLSPDLKVTAFTSPNTGTAGQPVTVSWTVKNIGAGATESGAFTERFYLSSDFTISSDDIYLGGYTKTGILAKNASYSYSMDVFLPNYVTGNRIIIMKTDADNTEYEYNGEDNNTANSSIVISNAPPSDLIITSISIPSTVIAGATANISYKIKNKGVNPATGYVKDAIYISKDEVWDINDVLFSSYQYYISLAPASELSKTINASINNLSLGYYHAIVRTDILNNINEANDNNNELVSTDTMKVSVKNLPFKTLTYDTLYDDKEMYYKIESHDTLKGETMLLTLKGDSVNGANELYLRYLNMPTRIEYDYSYTDAFKGNQEIIVPSLEDSTYYIMAYGNTLSSNLQKVSLYAKILQFEIRSVNATEGGNTGKVTIQVKGSKFENGMKLSLENDSATYYADTVYYIDPINVFATFNLQGAILGKYDVVATKSTSVKTKLIKGFEIVKGIPSDLQVTIQKPANTRPQSIFGMTLEYVNNGNTDIDLPTVLLKSLANAPIGLSVAALENKFVQLQLALKEQNGPPDLLRPDAGGSILIYTKSSTGLGYQIMLPGVK